MKTFFIDESGDLGAHGKYFVLAMLMPRNSKRINSIVHAFRKENFLDEIKANTLSFFQKQKIINDICSLQDYEISCIIADKFFMKRNLLFSYKNLLYNHLISLLIRKHIENTYEDVTLLLDYIKIKAYLEWNFRGNVYIQYVDSKNSNVIQAADLVANTIYAKYEYKQSSLYNKIFINYSIFFPKPPA